MPQYSSHGIQLQIGDGASPENFIPVAHLRDITPPARQWDTEDVTSHDSGGWREFIPTVRSLGEVSFEMGWDPADPGQQALISAFNDGSKKNFKVVFPAGIGKTFAFAGYVSSLETSGAVAGAQTMSVTIRPTGPVTITPQE